MPHPSARTASRGRLARLLAGPFPALPRPVDAAADWWAGRPPRVRAVVVLLAVVAGAAVTEARVRAAERRWGGEPVTVLVAARDLGVGEPATDLRSVRLPPRSVPPGAISRLDEDAVLSVGLPAGTVLTDRHVDPRGPAAGLAEGLRAVPIPVEEGWGMVAGAWVDVWLLGDAASQGRLVARSRPVLEVTADHRPIALVGLAEREVEMVTEGLGAGHLLLAHAPAPAVGD